MPYISCVATRATKSFKQEIAAAAKDIESLQVEVSALLLKKECPLLGTIADAYCNRLTS
jgi:hypothetical protein